VGFAIDKNEVYLVLGDPQRFHGIPHGRAIFHCIDECNLSLGAVEVIIQLSVESEGHVRHTAPLSPLILLTGI
jgi:hypothetical protein